MGQVLAMVRQDGMWQAGRRLLYWMRVQPPHACGMTQDDLRQHLHLRMPEKAAELEAVGTAQRHAASEMTFDMWAAIIRRSPQESESMRVHSRRTRHEWLTVASV